MKFHEKLKRIRLNENLSIAEMAKLFNIDGTTYSKYEKGKRKPTLEFINEVLKKFNISANWFHFSESPTYLKHQKGKNKIGVDESINRLIEQIKEFEIEKIECTIDPNGRIDKSLSPENILYLLYYMIIDKETREDIFANFHYIILPKTKKRLTALPDDQQ
ncbi:MAG: helix-turn-helix domain-containing protein [Candidatus Omnitrophota bacterium]